MSDPVGQYFLKEDRPSTGDPVADFLALEGEDPVNTYLNPPPPSIQPQGTAQKVSAVVADEIRKLGRDIVNALEYSASAGTSPGQAPPVSFQLRQHGKRAALHQRAIAGDPEALEIVASSERGAAFLASTVASFGLAGIAPQLIRPLLPFGPLRKSTVLAAKALAFTASEGASGALYGLVRPREEGETALEAAGTDAAVFVLGGAAFAGVFKALGFGARAIGELGSETIGKLRALDRAGAQKVAKRAKEILDDTNAEIRKNGGDPEGLSPELATATEARSINQALDELFASPPKADEPSPYKPDVPQPTPVTAAAKPSVVDPRVAADPRIVAKRAEVAAAGEKMQAQVAAVAAEARAPKVVGGPILEEWAKAKGKPLAQLLKRELSPDAVTNDKTLAGIADQVGKDVAKARGKDPSLIGLDAGLPAPKAIYDEVVELVRGRSPYKELDNTAAALADEVVTKGGQSGPLEEAALVNDAINAAVADTKTLDIVGEKVQQEAAKVVKRRSRKKSTEKVEKKVEKLISDAIDSDQPGGAFLEDLKDVVADTPVGKPLEKPAKTVKGRKPKKKPSKLDNDPLTDVPTPWGEAAGIATPEASGWASLNRAHEAVRELFTGAAMRKKLADLGITVPEGTPDSELHKFLKDEAGAVSARVAARLALTGLGTYGNLQADKIEDDGLRNVAEAVSWLTIAAGLSGFIKDGIKTNATLKRWAGWRDVRQQLSTAGSEEGANAWAGMVNVGNWEKTMKLRYLPRVYKTPQEREALAYVIAEGTAAPEWHMLSREQQIQAAAENAYNFAFAMPWKVARNYLTDYVSIIFPKEVAHRFSDFWKANGAGRFPSLREAVNWARQNNLAEPIKDGVFMQAKYTELMHKAMADVALKKTFTQMGLIAPVPKAGAALPNGWREISGAGLAGRQMAPEDVANLMEVLGQEGSLSSNKLVNAIDRIKRTYLYHINLVAIDLIRNMTLAASSVSLRHPMAWFDAMQKVVKLDPVIRDWSRHGLDVTGQIDFGPLETVIKSIPQLNPTKNPFLKGYRFFNHIVLDIIQPGTILFAAELRKTQWLRKTGGKHLPGSPEYNAKMREIAEFANTVGGRLNQTFQHPSLKNAMKLAFFAPSWRQTRFNLFARAAGDLGDLKVFGGSKEFNEAWYLHAKMRQGMLFMGLTFGLSKMLGGEEPQFDVNNYRYYIRTGVFNEKGRELGIDFLGWYQDDLKLTSNPLEWLWAGANPVIKEGVEFFSGRDYNGNALTMGKRLEGLATGFGTTSAAASLIAQGVRAATGTEDISTSDLIKTGSDVLTIPNVKTLPTHAEVTLSRVAKRILEEQGIPADKDAIYDLMQTMRGAILRDRDLGDAILPYIAYKKRQYSQGTPFLPLIDDMKDVLEDMVNSDVEEP